MKSNEYKQVKKEVQKYIRIGKPIAAAHVMEQYEAFFTDRQYYEINGMIFEGLNRKAGA